MNTKIKQVIDWLLSQGLSPLPVAPKQDARKYPRVTLAKEDVYTHCKLDESLNPYPLYTGKNPSYLNRLGEPNTVDHSTYQKKQPSEAILKRWFQNPNNGIGALGKIDFCWLDLDSKCFDSQLECEGALNKLFEKCPELLGAICEKTHSGGYRLGFRLKEPKNFTNFSLEIGGKHVGELLGAGRFAILAPTIGPSGNPYENISFPDKLPLIEKIDFVYPVTHQKATPTIAKPLKVRKDGGENKTDIDWAITYLSAINPSRADSYEDWLQVGMALHSVSLDLLPEWDQWSQQSAKYDAGSCETKWNTFKPGGSLGIGSLGHWAKENGFTTAKNNEDSTKVEVKTTTPLQAPTTYTDDPNPDKSSDESDEPIILPPSYSYQERAVTAIYGRGKYLSYKEELYKYNGKYYELLESELEGLKIRDWAKNECEWDNKEKRYVYKYLTPACLKGIWEWAIITFAVSTKLINPPGLNLANGILTIFPEQGKIKSTLLPHSPAKYFLYCSEVAYNPDADPTECNNLLKALDPPQRKIFAQTLAAGLDLAWVRKKQGRIKAIIAKGTGSNGKDSIKSAIARIFTPELICNVPFSSFKAYDNGSKYDLTKLRDKKINWASENNQTTVLDRSESLNCAITGNGIDYRDMNKLPKEFEPVCINIFNVNIVPKATGGLESFLSRFAVIEFNKTFANDPDESQDQIKADARFAYDPDFMRDEVCPAFLNLLLEEFPNVVDKGIDYSPLKSSLDILQEDSNHLFGFIRDYKIVADPKDRIYVADLWECLTAWYIENGTLEFEELSNGNKKPIWHDRSNKYDRNIVASNQVIPRFKELFPKARDAKETKDKNRKNKAYIAGIGFSQETKENEPSENDKNSEQVSSTASLPHHSHSTRVTASPIASLPLTSPYLEKSEAVGKAVSQCGEAVMTVYQESEAVRQCDQGNANSENPGKWFPISTVGLENLYMGDWVARLDGTPLKLGTRRKNFWEAIIPDSGESLEVPFSEIIHVYR
jgi:phage/plasmid-associated DNA primase